MPVFFSASFKHTVSKHFLISDPLQTTLHQCAPPPGQDRVRFIRSYIHSLMDVNDPQPSVKKSQADSSTRFA